MTGPGSGFLSRAALLIALGLSPVAADAGVAPRDLGVVRSFQDGFTSVWLNWDQDPADERHFLYGRDGDTVLALDFNANGKWTLVAVRRATLCDQTADGLLWLFDHDEDPEHEHYRCYGFAGDMPIIGDWDGNGTYDIGVVRAGYPDGKLHWLLDFDAAGDADHELEVVYGQPGDIPLVGDWDADGVATAGVVRPLGTYLQWRLDNNADGNADWVCNLGAVGDTPVVGDWVGNGRSYIGVFRDGLWHLDTNYDCQFDQTRQFGLPGDRPIIGNWNRSLGRPELSVPGTFNGFGVIDLGATAVGAPRPGRNVEVRNDGGQPLQLGAVQVPAGFQISGGWGGGRVLNPGESAYFTVELLTTVASGYAGTLAIPSNDSDENPFTIALRGQVNGPELDIDGLTDGQGTVVEFGTYNRGAPPQSREFRVRNSANRPLNISAIELPPGFRLSATDGFRPPFALSAYSSAILAVELDTYFPGTFGGRIVIHSDDGDENPFDFPVRGVIHGNRAGAPPGQLGVSRPLTAPWSGIWVDRDGDPEEERQYLYGLTSDVLLPGDWDGDGAWQLAAVRADQHCDNGEVLHWLIDYDEDAEPELDLCYGRPGDLPVVGDWDLNGTSNMGVVRAGYPDGYLHWLLDTDGDRVHNMEFVYGFPGDRPVIGDWNGDGVTDIGVARADGGTWLWLLDTNGDLHVDLQFHFGAVAKTPVTGDWDGNGRSNVGVFQNGTWELDRNRDEGVEVTRSFGLAGDRPLVGTWGAAPNRPEITLPGVASGIGLLDFGTLPQGAPVRVHRVSVRNDGAQPLTLGPVSAPAGCRVDGGWGAATTLTSGQSAWFDLVLLTDTPRILTGNLSIPSNDGDENPFLIRVQGTISGPDIAVDGIVHGQTGALDFGTPQQGEQPPQRQLTVRNQGNADLRLENVAVPAGFQLLQSPPPVIAPAASATLRLALLTGATGTFSGLVIIRSNDWDQSGFSFPVSGRVLPGTAPPPAVGAPHRVGVARRYGQFGMIELDRNGDGIEDREFVYGRSGEGGALQAYVSGDWYGDGYDGVAVVTPLPRTTGAPLELQWLLDHDETPSAEAEVWFGLAGDIPVTGDWNGDRIADLGVVRGGYPTDGDGRARLRWFWRIPGNDNRESDRVYGLDGDVPVVGDWNGDGRLDIGVVRDIGDGLLHWYLDVNGDQVHDYERRYGFPGDHPITGDWDADGISDIGIARPEADGRLGWYLDTDHAGSGGADVYADLEVFWFGDARGQPLTGRWPTLDRPEITVEAIASQPHQQGTLDFGSVKTGTTAPERSLWVRNDGGRDLVLEGPVVPTGLDLVQGWSAGKILRQGERVELKLRMPTGEQRTLSGEVLIRSNDADESSYRIAVSGSVEQDLVLRRDGDRLYRLYYGGKPIRLVGYGDYGMLSEAAFDYGVFFRDVLKPNGINLVRVFVSYHWTHDLSPFRKIDGKYDLTQFDSTFFARLRDFVSAAEQHGIIVQLALFDEAGLESDADDLRFKKSPYNAENNDHGRINDNKNIDIFDNIPPDGGDTWLWENAHKPLIREVVDTVGGFGNVIYEVINEPMDFGGDVGDEKFHAAVVTELRARLAGKAGSKVISVNVKNDTRLASWAIEKDSNIDLIAFHIDPDAIDGVVKNYGKELPLMISNDGKTTQCNRDYNYENRPADCEKDATRVELSGEYVTRTRAGDPGSIHLEFLDKGLNGSSWKTSDYNPRVENVDDDIVALLRTDPAHLKAGRDLSHARGRAEADGWSANPAQDSAGLLAYGPGTTLIPPGEQQALFRLMIGDPQGVGADQAVVSIEVFDKLKTRAIARRVLYARDFARQWEYQDFALKFVAPTTAEIDFRVFWFDVAYVRLDQVQVSPAGAPGAGSGDEGGPLADAGGQYAVPIGAPLALDASGSVAAPTAGQLTYAWDINGDGNFSDAIGVAPTLPWAQLRALGVAAAPGVYGVRVQVRDTGGAAATSDPAILQVFSAADTDGDGLPDDRDTDDDGMPDDYESAKGFDAKDPTDAATDADADGLGNQREYQLGTDPRKRDSDDDGVPDGTDAYPLDPRGRTPLELLLPNPGGWRVILKP